MKTYKPNMALVKRLIMKLDPEFYGLSLEEQNRKRQQFIHLYMEKVDEYLYKELFGLGYDPEAGYGDDPLDSDQLNVFNAHTTALSGIGENYFRFNELHGKDFDLSSFENLRDFDQKEFNFQQSANQRDFPDRFIERPYRLYLNHCWARILDESQRFLYLTISSMSYYILDAMEQADDLIDELIPSEFVKGENHGENDNGGFIWDMRRNAHGKERELEELIDRVREYQQKRYYEMNDEFHFADTDVFLIERTDYSGDAVMDVIVKNTSAAEKIRFEYFLRDCRAHETDDVELNALIKRELSAQESFIREQYDDICKNFDPTVVKFKKKYKVVFSPEAIDDLDRIESEERSPDDEE
ncbi:hypothetical protein [Oleiphilus sp. HI0080]|uniref:hypothetical protein n=1 Tax=Oleiphilus sp. HI0080 TaxID=1822255 RepID=UPI000A9595C3|nr:hypothetical protein [Oleiphilus sp. HI0080]